MSLWMVHADLLSSSDGMHVCADWIWVYTLIRKSFWRMESEPTLTPTEKKTLYRKKEEDRTHDTA